MRSLLHKPLLGFTILLAYQWIGEALVKVMELPVPGAVLGMFALFLSLLLLKRQPGALQSASQSLLSNLSLLFVPAAVGALGRLYGLRGELPALLALIGLSTLFTLALSGGLLQFFSRRNSHV